MPEPKTLPIEAPDGHRFEAILMPADRPRNLVYWLPALGVSARAYRPLARALAERGITSVVHEWRGIGSSSLRAGRGSDWGYRELLETDIEAGLAVLEPAMGPRAIGGHSLGAQLAALALARRPECADGLVITGGGAPYWKSFPWPMKGLLPLVFGGFRSVSALRGYYPGKRLGFAGNEARRLIRDWARSGWTGCYRPEGVETDLEAAMADLEKPVLTVSMDRDWFVPRGSLDWLLGKLPRCKVHSVVLDREDFKDQRPDHFGWMKEPDPVAERIDEWL